MVRSLKVTLSTRGQTEVQDITDRVERAVAESGIRTGLACIFTPSSTSALTTIEFEAGAVEDLRRALERMAPTDAEYLHNLRWGDGNGHAHLRAALLGPSLCLPVVDGRPMLGTWQQVVFIDFDVRPRRRELQLQVIGEPG
jgi:secondary thiamine-phosphate synthase enzyme